MLLRRPGPGATASSLAVLVVLVGLPLAGLVGAIVEPPPDPLGGRPTVASVLASSGVGELLLSSLGLSVVVAVLATAAECNAALARWTLASTACRYSVTRVGSRLRSCATGPSPLGRSAHFLYSSVLRKSRFAGQHEAYSSIMASSELKQ